MSTQKKTAPIEMIPVDSIYFLNPRVRNKKTFVEITENMTKVGLKRPITVKRSSKHPGMEYELVCGQGRVEAFMACGQSKIPARIIDATEKEALIMSLVENIARPLHRPLDLLQGIEILRKEYEPKDIATKTGLSLDYVNAVLNLLERGEERLLAAVESGQIPVSVAVKIAASPDDEQLALQDAYEQNLLRGKKLLFVQQLLDMRRRRGKGFRSGKQTPRKSRDAKVSGQDLARLYRKEAERMQKFEQKARVVNDSLTFVVEGMRQLLQDDHFNTLLRAEKITTMPKQLRELVEAKA